MAKLILLKSLKKVLYKIIWKVEKKLKSEFYLNNSRNKVDLKPENEFSTAYKKFVKKITDDPKVRKGLFKGLVYPRSKSFRSSLYPKLIGSYELELEEDLNNLIKINYKNKNLVPDELDYNEKYRLFKEYRKAQMSWLILVSN